MFWIILGLLILFFGIGGNWFVFLVGLFCLVVVIVIYLLFVFVFNKIVVSDVVMDKNVIVLME